MRKILVINIILIEILLYNTYDFFILKASILYITLSS